MSINNIDYKTILKTLRKGIPADGNNNNFKDRIIELNFPEYFTSLVEQSDKFEIKISKKDSALGTSIVVNAFNYKELNKARSNFATKRDNKLDFKIIDSLNTAYLKIGSFEGWRIEKQGYNYDEYLQRFFNTLKRKNVGNLIIDLR